jgi:hypothetical protein
MSTSLIEQVSGETPRTPEEKPSQGKTDEIPERPFKGLGVRCWGDGKIIPLATLASWRFKFFSDQSYLTVICAALCRLVREDDVVYHGNAGHLLLQGVDHVLRVRVIAPLPYRIKAAMETHGFDEKEAETYIRKKDEERVMWTRFLYGVEWRDPALYDLVLNLEKVSVEMACNVIVCMAERPEFQMTPESLRQLEDLYLASHVRARLFLNSKVGAAAAKIDVTAAGGIVHLAGVLPSETFRQEALATARSLPEVKHVRADWLGSHLEPL